MYKKSLQNLTSGRPRLVAHIIYYCNISLQSGNWSSNSDTCKEVIELAEHLLDYSIKARQEAESKDHIQANQQLSSARLTGQAVIKAVEKQNWSETENMLKELKELFNNVTEYMKSVM